MYTTQPPHKNQPPHFSGLPEEALQGDLDWLLGPRWEAMRAEAASGGWLVSPDELQLGTLLGAGAFGSTYRATWRGQAVAVKCVAVQGATAAETFAREVQLLASVHHPNVLRLYGMAVLLLWLCCIGGGLIG